jgi:hypothetical protein
MAMMPTPWSDTTDSDVRADLARWAVSLRRAAAAGTGQTNGLLAENQATEEEPEKAAYCCLGIWCEIARAAGRVERKEPSLISSQIPYVHPERGLATASLLPSGLYLDGSENPLLLSFLDREDHAEDLEPEAEENGYVHADGTGDVAAFVDYEARACAAADLNDDYGLPFGHIADVVIWRYQLTAEELAAAEAAPRVPLVEGPES